MVSVSSKESIKMYQTINKYLHNEEDSKSLVCGLQDIVSAEFSRHLAVLATKQDLKQLELDLIIRMNSIEARVSTAEVRMEQGFKEQLKWMIVLMFGFSSLIIAVIKFL